MTDNDFRHLRNVLEDYSGRTVNLIDAVPDPNVSCAWAIQGIFPDVGVVQFLVRNVAKLQHVRESDLEECDFGVWPPTARM